MHSKRDYVAIAAILHKAWLGDDNHTVNQIVDDLCDLFAKDNPRFDRKRFEAAVYGDMGS